MVLHSTTTPSNVTKSPDAAPAWASSRARRCSVPSSYIPAISAYSPGGASAGMLRRARRPPPRPAPSRWSGAASWPVGRPTGPARRAAPAGRRSYQLHEHLVAGRHLALGLPVQYDGQRFPRRHAGWSVPVVTGQVIAQQGHSLAQVGVHPPPRVLGRSHQPVGWLERPLGDHNRAGGRLTGGRLPAPSVTRASTRYAPGGALAGTRRRCGLRTISPSSQRAGRMLAAAQGQALRQGQGAFPAGPGEPQRIVRLDRRRRPAKRA